jgi:hypothetical protein
MRPAKLLIGAAAVAALAARRAVAARECPEPASGEVDRLRDELRRELDWIARADIKASGSRRESAGPPG